MKKLRVILKIVLTVVILISVVIFVKFIGGGRYIFAQEYEVNVSQKSLVKILQNLKNENPQLSVPEIVGSPVDTFMTNGDFRFYFYFKKENEIAYVVVSSLDPTKSSIFYYQVNKGLEFGNWKKINVDFPREENLREKYLLKSEVLDKLGLPYKDKGNGMFVFWK